MIIGISGKIGSGKDTVGKIIQTICYLKLIDVPYSIAAATYNLEKHFSGNTYYGNWHIKKFAGKLKETVANLIGCKVEDLESQEFKRQLLGEEWKQNYRVTSYDKDAYEKLSSEFQVRLGHYTLGAPVHIAEEWIPDVRWLLQTVGTEAMRNNVHQNVWVNALFSNYKKNMQKSSSREDAINLKYPDWIITDMRFPNEMQAVKNREGITVRINRYDLSRGTIQQQKEWAQNNAHPSETALDNSEFDYTIDNDGTIEELIEMVKNVLIDAKII